MKRFNDMNRTLKVTLLGSALALAAGPASAEVYDLCAAESAKTMPDGSTVPVWGYALDQNGDLTDGCQDAGGAPAVVTLPGPSLKVTDGTLTVNLRNELPEPTSIVIPGLPMPTSVGAGPTWNDGTSGPRGGDPAKRVRSFGAEAAADGTESYSWTSVRPGTFIYHSGTHPQKQVYMGLYGAVTQNAIEAGAGPAEAYPGVEYFNELVLFYSEIDPDLNAAVNEIYHPTGLVQPYSTSINYHARWFLVNGEPYEAGMGDIMTGTDGVTPLATGQRTLVRFLSTAGNTHVPTLQGMHMSIQAEDGRPYTWQDGATVMGSAPREQYSVQLPPLKTKDAIVRAPADGRYAVYDGNGYMTNPSDPGDVTVGDTVGGMLRFLAFGPAGTNQPPVANANGPYSGVTDAVATTSITFDGTGSTDDNGIVLYEWDFDGDGTYDATGPTPTHTYPAVVASYSVILRVTDQDGATGTDTTAATIALNQPPTANANGPYSGVTDGVAATTPITFDGTGSTDDIAIVLYEWDFNGDGIYDATGPKPTHTYPALAASYNVTLRVTDDFGATGTDTTTATIALNQAPTADANGPYTGSTAAPVIFDGTGSSDPDGTIVSYAWDFDASDGIQLDGSGPTPSHTYAADGTYTVTLTVTDNYGATATATATAQISAANAPPVADAGGPYTVSINPPPAGTGGTVAFNGTGSSDPDGTIASYDWDFGDGTVVLDAGPTPSHTYAASSTYIVTLTVTDNGGATATDTAIASVVANQAPVANDDTASVQRSGASVTINVTANDFDVDGTIDPTTVAITSVPPQNRGTVVNNGDGTVTFTTSGGQTGTLFLTYTVQDDQGAVSNTATVTINVTR